MDNIGGAIVFLLLLFWFLHCMDELFLNGQFNYNYATFEWKRKAHFDFNFFNETKKSVIIELTKIRLVWMNQQKKLMLWFLRNKRKIELYKEEIFPILGGPNMPLASPNKRNNIGHMSIPSCTLLSLEP